MLCLVNFTSGAFRAIKILQQWKLTFLSIVASRSTLKKKDKIRSFFGSKFLLLTFFLMLCDGIDELKTLRKIFLILVVLKNCKCLNDLQDVVFLQNQKYKVVHTSR